MDRRFSVLRRGLLFLALLIAVITSLTVVGLAQKKNAPAANAQVQSDPDGGSKHEAEEADKDDPFARMQWQKSHFGTITPEYRTRVLNEAIRQNKKLRRDGGSVAGRADGSNPPGTAGPIWQNIGPTGADSEQNGSWTGYVRDSGRLRTILTHPTDGNIVYVLSSAGGLWKTTNFESDRPTWTPLTDYLPTTAGGAVTFGRDPNTLYLGLGDPYDQITVGGAMVKSTDGGATWSPMVELAKTVSIRDVAVDTSTSQDIVLVATDGGLYRSVDGGATYTQVTGSFANRFVWSFAKTSAGWLMTTQEASGCTIFARACYSSGAGVADGVIYLSTDQGATWAPVMNGITGAIGRTTLAVGAPGDSVVYALAADAYYIQDTTKSQVDVFKSTDGGQTWAATGTNSTKAPVVKNNYVQNMNVLSAQAWYNQLILVDPTDTSRNTVYIGGTYSAAKTTDGGSTWNVLSTWLYGYPDANGNPMEYVHADMHAAAFKTSGTPTVLLGTDGGIFASTDNGSHWTSDKNNGLVTHMFYTITGTPSFPNFAMGGLQDNGTRARVGNSTIWNQTNGGDGFGVAMSQTQDLKASFQSVYNLKIRRDLTNLPPVSYTLMQSSLGAQSDGGFYTPIYAPPATADPTGKYFFAYGAVGTTQRIFMTNDGGVRWYQLSRVGTTTGLPSGVAFRDDPFDFSVSPTNLNHLAIGANGGRVFVSSDFGATWTQTSLNSTTAVPGFPGFISNVTFADDTTIWVSSVSQAEGLQAGVRTVRVVKSTDNGATWSDASAGLPDVPVTRVLVDPRDTTHNTVYAATHIGVYITTDGGASWAPYGSGLPNVRVQDMYMPPDGSYLRIATYGRGIWEVPQLEFVSASVTDDGNSCDKNGSLGNNETGHLTVSVMNQSTTPMTGVVATVSSDNSHLTFPLGNTIQIGGASAQSEAAGSLALGVSGASGVEVANLTITITDPSQTFGALTVHKTIRINYDEQTASSSTATFEPVNHGWTVAGATTALPDTFGWERKEVNGTTHTFAVGDSNAVAEASLVSPVIHFGADPVSFSVSHRHSFEAASLASFYDGGVIEISTDNGATWNSLSSYITYPGTITANTSNPLGAGTAAFGYRNASFPNYDTLTVNLSTDFADKDVQIRFRVGSDDNTGDMGWEIQSVSFTGLPGTPFTSIVAHNEACPTTIALTSTPNPAYVSDPVAFVATVTGGVTAITGNVVLQENGVTLGTASASTGQAMINTSFLAAGAHNLTATFEGDAGHATSTSTVYVQTINTQPRTQVTPSSLTFPATRVGKSSVTQTVTVKNVGSEDVVFSGFAVDADFTQTNDCPANLAVDATCTVTVSFKPTDLGTRNGFLTVSSNAPTSPDKVTLSGPGQKPVAKLSKTSLDMGNSMVGTATSASKVTLTNTGNVALAITSIAATGTNSSEFTVTNTCGTSLAVNASCDISVTFKPTAPGSRTAKITLTDDGLDSPQSVTLTGTGRDLTLNANQTIATTAAGGVVNYPMTVTGSPTFTGEVTLTCTGMPANGSCEAVPNKVTLGTNGLGSFTVVVHTSTGKTSGTLVGSFLAFGLFGLCLFPAAARSRKGRILMVLALVVLVVIAVGGMVGCGGFSNSNGGNNTSTGATVAPGTYMLTITASTANGVQQTQQLSLTVQ